jgi:mannose-6-phosphate isomerase
MQQDYGGNLITEVDLNRPGRQLLGAGPYEYYFHRSDADQEVLYDSLSSLTLFVFEKPDEARICVEGLDQSLEKGDCVQFERAVARVSIENGPVVLLVAGTNTPHPDSESEGIRLTREADVYRVAKPWGHELWLNGQHPCYALKEIFLKRGNRTSMQYHHFKQETNALFDGVALLHYSPDASIPNDEVQQVDTASVEVRPVSTIGVWPPTLHRLEAVTDILLYEVSTPHLDDVVRVLDDSRRADGRIDGEHGT